MSFLVKSDELREIAKQITSETLLGEDPYETRYYGEKTELGSGLEAIGKGWDGHEWEWDKKHHQYLTNAENEASFELAFLANNNLITMSEMSEEEKAYIVRSQEYLADSLEDAGYLDEDEN